MSFVQELKTVPFIALGYFKNHCQTLKDAKKDKRVLAPVLFTLLFFVSSVAAIGGFLEGMQKTIGKIHLAGLDFSDISFSQFNYAVIFGSVLAFILIVNYLLTRLISIKIFMRKTKKVMLESFIEFSLHSLPVSAIFLIGGLLGMASCVFALAALIIGVFYLFIVLVLGISTSLDPEKIVPRFYIALSLLTVVGFFLISLVEIALFAFIGFHVIQSVINNIEQLIRHIEGFIEDFFHDFLSTLKKQG